MKTISKIIFASTLALSAVVPAFAYEGDYPGDMERNTQVSTTDPLAQQVVGKRARAHRAIDARAYEPAGAPVDEVLDFGIGSQR